MVAHYGFMEVPDVPPLLEGIEARGLTIDLDQVSYFLGRETLIATNAPGMAVWRDELFVWMSRNASSASHYFALPPNQVIELGAQIEM